MKEAPPTDLWTQYSSAPMWPSYEQLDDYPVIREKFEKAITSVGYRILPPGTPTKPKGDHFCAWIGDRALCWKSEIGNKVNGGVCLVIIAPVSYQP